MNKFVLFLCFLLAIDYTKSEVIDGIDVTELFENFLKIAKGLTDNNEYKCTNILINNKEKLIKAAEDMLRKKVDLNSALLGSAAQLIFVEDFSSICNIGKIIGIVTEITKAEGIKKMGQNMINNASELENLFNEILKATDNDGRLMVVGKIIRYITGITLH